MMMSSGSFDNNTHQSGRRRRRKCLLCKSSRIELLSGDDDDDESIPTSNKRNNYGLRFGLRLLLRYLRLELRELASLSGGTSTGGGGGGLAGCSKEAERRRMEEVVLESLCGECVTLIGRFAEAYRKWEAARLGLSKCVGTLRERIRRTAGKGGLEEEENESLKQIYRKCNLQLCSVPRVRLQRNEIESWTERKRKFARMSIPSSSDFVAAPATAHFLHPQESSKKNQLESVIKRLVQNCTIEQDGRQIQYNCEFCPQTYWQEFEWRDHLMENHSVELLSILESGDAYFGGGGAGIVLGDETLAVKIEISDDVVSMPVDEDEESMPIVEHNEVGCIPMSPFDYPVLQPQLASSNSSQSSSGKKDGKPNSITCSICQKVSVSYMHPMHLKLSHPFEYFSQQHLLPPSTTEWNVTNALGSLWSDVMVVKLKTGDRYKCPICKALSGRKMRDYKLHVIDVHVSTILERLETHGNVPCQPAPHAKPSSQRPRASQSARTLMDTVDSSPLQNRSNQDPNLFECIYCGKTTSNSQSHRLHVLSLHYMQYYAVLIPPGTSEEMVENAVSSIVDDCKIVPTSQKYLKKYFCPLCTDKHYPRPSILRTHTLNCHFDKVLEKLGVSHTNYDFEARVQQEQQQQPARAATFSYGSVKVKVPLDADGNDNDDDEVKTLSNHGFRTSRQGGGSRNVFDLISENDSEEDDSGGGEGEEEDPLEVRSPGVHQPTTPPEPSTHTYQNRVVVATTGQFQCNVCLNVFHSTNELTQHYQQNHFAVKTEMAERGGGGLSGGVIDDDGTLQILPRN